MISAIICTYCVSFYAPLTKFSGGLGLLLVHLYRFVIFWSFGSNWVDFDDFGIFFCKNCGSYNCRAFWAGDRCSRVKEWMKEAAKWSYVWIPKHQGKAYSALRGPQTIASAFASGSKDHRQKVNPTRLPQGDLATAELAEGFGKQQCRQWQKPTRLLWKEKSPSSRP